MRRYFALFFAMGGALLVSCQENLTDEDLIREAVLSSPFFSQRSAVGYGDTTKLMAAQTDSLDPVIWWREGTDGDYDIIVDIVGDSAYVKFWGITSGNLHVYGLDEDTFQVDSIIKPYADSAWIEGSLTKVDEGTWVLTHVTGVLSTSTTQPPSFNIDSVRITCGSYDTLFVTPLHIFSVDSLWSLGAGDSIQVVVYTDGEDLQPVLHLLDRNEHKWIRMASLGGGVYSAGYDKTASEVDTNLHWIAVDVHQRRALVEPEAPYECEIWLIPYWVH